MGKISDLNTRTNITISKELKSKLEKIAKEQNRSFNNLVITILKNFTQDTNESVFFYAIQSRSLLLTSSLMNFLYFHISVDYITT